ncbi:hypothetical protein [Kurthia sp. Dielmo]|uniref:hypothetical protein n=1 Tax=Kurthia sp. Dielmo TaxID=1033738 RepID=UPI00111DB96F|nr:hypothetical protein [Kurthia sp. Dielmo]
MDFKEYEGFKPIDSTVVGKMNFTEADKQVAAENAIKLPNKGLIVEIEAIHESVTSNFTRYTKESMKQGLPSWTAPYAKPVILHHNEKDGKVIGRVLSAEYRENGEAGLPCVVIQAVIYDEDAIEQVLDGRLLTTSIGVRVNDVRCSICDHHIISEKDGCPHHARGTFYNGQLCTWDMNDMYVKEISYVVVPSDKFSKNTRILENNSVKSVTFSESANFNNLEGGSNMVQKTSEDLGNQQPTTSTPAPATSVEPQTSVSFTESEQYKADQQTIMELKESANNETQLRQRAEQQVVSKETELRSVLLDSLNGISIANGKGELNRSKFENRTIESLKDRLADELEELTMNGIQKEEPAEHEPETTSENPAGENVQTLEPVQRGVYAESANDNSKEDPATKTTQEEPVNTSGIAVKESAANISKAENPTIAVESTKTTGIKIMSNMELEEAAANIFSNVASQHIKY